MAFAAASKAFRASTVCAHVVLALSVPSTTRRTAKKESFRVIYLTSWKTEYEFAGKPELMAGFYAAQHCSPSDFIIAPAATRAATQILGFAAPDPSIPYSFHLYFRPLSRLPAHR
jgi:hypothetical protein